MKKIIFVVLVLLIGCASGTTINTIPDKAKVYLDNKLVGTTPYFYYDRDESGKVTKLTLVADGYKTREVSIKRDVLYVHRIFLPPILGLPWMYGYEESYFYELDKL